MTICSTIMNVDMTSIFITPQWLLGRLQKERIYLSTFFRLFIGFIIGDED